MFKNFFSMYTIPSTWKPEERVRSPETGITQDCEPPYCAEKRT